MQDYIQPYKSRLFPSWTKCVHVKIILGPNWKSWVPVPNPFGPDWKSKGFIWGIIFQPWAKVVWNLTLIFPFWNFWERCVPVPNPFGPDWKSKGFIWGIIFQLWVTVVWYLTLIFPFWIVWKVGGQSRALKFRSGFLWANIDPHFFHQGPNGFI